MTFFKIRAVIGFANSAFWVAVADQQTTATKRALLLLVWAALLIADDDCFCATVLLFK